MDQLCHVCKESLKFTNWRETTWNNPHYKLFHPEYVRWTRRWIKGSIILATSLLGLSVPILILSNGVLLLTIASAVIAMMSPLQILIVFRIFQRKIEQFQAEWKAGNNA